MLIVQKYGGTSLGNTQRIHAAAARAAQARKEGAQVVVVVSAQGDLTDILMNRGREFCIEAHSREMDAYLSVGEQMSAALMAMALKRHRLDAVSLTGWQAGIHTDAVHGNARILRIDTGRIRRELESGKVVIVTGFQGVSPEGNITTLGRGGSDTTAVALAGALGADRCQIFTDVDGVYDKDPRLHPDACRFDTIGYDAMLNMTREGAQVLHDRCVELAKAQGICIEVCSAFRQSPGTKVCDSAITE